MCWYDRDNDNLEEGNNCFMKTEIVNKSSKKNVKAGVGATIKLSCAIYI